MHNQLTFRYGHTDSDGNQHWVSTNAESVVHAADIAFRINPELWEVTTQTVRPRDITLQVLHVLKRYIEPAYRDGREFSPATLREVKKDLAQ